MARHTELENHNTQGLESLARSLQQKTPHQGSLSVNTVSHPLTEHLLCQ